MYWDISCYLPYMKISYLDYSNTSLIKLSVNKNMQNDNSWVYLNKTQLQANSILEKIKDSVRRFYHLLGH